MITPNRDALKALSCLNIDIQTLCNRAAIVFSYNGQMTPEYTALCQEVKEVFNDVNNTVNSLKTFVDKLTSGN